MDSRPSHYYRTRYWVFAIFALLLPFVVFSAQEAIKDNSNNVADWLPESFVETQNLRWFSERFGSDAFLMISWEGGTLDDPRLAALAAELRKSLTENGEYHVPLIRSVIAGDELRKLLQQPPLICGLAAGVLAMVPNLLPCVLVLGTMGLAGMQVEIGSMMTASVALGIAVDDTLHFLTWFRRGQFMSLTRHEAVAFAYQKCAAAMTQTSLICGLGLLVYSLSPFVPIARFSWVMSAMLMSALVADLLVLPAILLSPLGRVFQLPRQRQTT